MRTLLSLSYARRAWKHPFRATVPPLTWGALAVAVAVTACERRSIQVYEIPKPAGEQTELMAAANLAGPPPAAAPSRTKPAAWKEQPLSEMRQGSFRAEGPDGANADVSVVSFPGTAGGVGSNLNRWRGQVELPPLPDEELQRTTEPVSAGPVQGLIVDYTSPPQSAKPSRILGAVLQTEDRSWFVKMMGPPAFVGAQKEIFEQFVRSFRFPTAQPEGDEQALPPGRPKSSNDQ